MARRDFVVDPDPGGEGLIRWIERDANVTRGMDAETFCEVTSANRQRPPISSRLLPVTFVFLDRPPPVGDRFVGEVADIGHGRRRIEILLRRNLLGLAREGPQQLNFRAAGVLVVFQLDVVTLAGHERNRRSGVADGRVLRPVVNQLHIIHPKAHTIVRPSREGVVAANGRFDRAGPADREVIGRDSSARSGGAPLEVDRFIRADSVHRSAQNCRFEVLTMQSGAAGRRAV